jgi:Zn-finger nucleic acid-binding protein
MSWPTKAIRSDAPMAEGRNHAELPRLPAPAAYRDERPRHFDDRRRYSDYDDDDDHHRSGHKKSRLKSFMDFFD